MSGLSEADTCRVHVTPKLQAAGWDREPHLIREQRTFTNGRIVVSRRGARRRPGKRADYLLCYRPDFTIAVVEAKAYAETLGLKFACAIDPREYLQAAFSGVFQGPVQRFELASISSWTKRSKRTAEIFILNAPAPGVVASALSLESEPSAASSLPV